MAPVYTIETARQLATSAQKMLDEHAEALSGKCLGCGRHRCSLRFAAAQAIVLHGKLPQRRPGASRPEHVNLKRVQ